MTKGRAPTEKLHCSFAYSDQKMRDEGNVDEATAYSPAQLPFPTLSLFSFSEASSCWNARSAVRWANISLRLIELVLSLGAAISLSALSPRRTKLRKYYASFKDYPGLLYLLAISIIAFLYATFQLFKGACDVEHRGTLISNSVSDFISFIFDMFVGYLLLSANSGSIAVIQRMYDEESLRMEAIVGVCFSIASFVVNEASVLLSGYMVCKKIFL